MADALSFTEIGGLHAELLPARTVLSLFSTGGDGGGGGGSSETNCNVGNGNLAAVNALNNVQALNNVLSGLVLGSAGNQQCS